jgi:hypothetical protein
VLVTFGDTFDSICLPLIGSLQIHYFLVSSFGHENPLKHWSGVYLSGGDEDPLTEEEVSL